MSKRTAVLTTTAALLLGMLIPAAGRAADPVRPIGNAIVEQGGRMYQGQYTDLYVHGTYGPDDISVEATRDRVTVRAINGHVLQAGYGCRQDQSYLVSCPTPERLFAYLYSYSDHFRMSDSVRQSAVHAEVWGGDGNDTLEAGWGSWFFTPRLLGGNGDDTLIGSAGPEQLWGGPGNDYIRPGGGEDMIDGGHGFMPEHYRRDDAECAARTHGFFDRLYDTQPSGPEGVDTLDLSNLSWGVMADLNICRLTDFVTSDVGMVWGIEKVIGTRYNDRLVGDEDQNTLNPGAGNDWVSGEGGADRLIVNDGWVDSVKACGDQVTADAGETWLGC